MTDYELNVVKAMEIYGGSFVKALATAFRHADPSNFYKLRTAFQEYWNQYTERAKWMDEKNDQK